MKYLEQWGSTMGNQESIILIIVTSFSNHVTFIIVMTQPYNIYMVFYHVQSTFMMLDTDNCLYHSPLLPCLPQYNSEDLDLKKSLNMTLINPFLLT